MPQAAEEEATNTGGSHHHKERQYQICSITKAPIYVSRPLPERCHLPPGIQTVKARVQISRPRLSRIEIDAYSCTNVTYLTCGAYFFGIRTSARNEEPAYNAIPADACWKFAHDANLTETAAADRAEHDIWTTGRMPSPPDGFMGDACAESWNVIAQRGSVDSKNGVHIESDLMNPNNCTIMDHKCIDNGHTVVWKVPDMHVFCSHELAGEFDALISMSHVLLPPVQSAFVLKPHSEVPKSVQECIGGTVLAAGNDALIKFLDTLPADITTPWMTCKLKDFLLPEEAREVYDLWAGLEERAHFNDVLNDFLVEEAEYGTYEEPTLGALEQEDELLPLNEHGRREGTERHEDATVSETTAESEVEARRQKRSPKTSKEWNYDEDDERDRAASKHMKHRFDKDLNATSSGKESEEEPDADTRPNPETDATADLTAEAEAENPKPPSNVSAEMSQTTRTVNTKMQYAIDTWGISESDNFRHLYQAICEMDANQVRITDFMWELMPTKATRYWLRRTDIAAVPAGEALAIYPCTQVRVDEVHWSQKINGTCYADIPVTFDGKLWFFQPGSRDLQRQSRTVNCSSKTVNIYRNGTTWLSSDGHQTHVNALEHHLKLKHHSLQLNLSAPSLYQSDATEVADRLTRFTNYERRINRLEDVMYAVELRTPTSGGNPLTEAGKELRAAFNRTVNVAKQKLEDWDPFAGLFQRWYHWLVAAVSILLAIAAIIMLWYCWPAVILCRNCIQSIRRRRRQWMDHRQERQSERRLIELQPVIAAVQAKLKTHEDHQPQKTETNGAAINAVTAMPVPHSHHVPTAPPEYRATPEATGRRDISLYEYYPEINLFRIESDRERPYITTEVTANGRSRLLSTQEPTRIFALRHSWKPPNGTLAPLYNNLPSEELPPQQERKQYACPTGAQRPSEEPSGAHFPKTTPKPKHIPHQYSRKNYQNLWSSERHR